VRRAQVEGRECAATSCYCSDNGEDEEHGKVESTLRRGRTDNGNSPIKEFVAWMDSTTKKLLRSSPLNPGDSNRPFDPEVAGDFYMIIIMVILMMIIILHHGADDYNHMAMQGDLQLGLHDGGY